MCVTCNWVHFVALDKIKHKVVNRKYFCNCTQPSILPVSLLSSGLQRNQGSHDLSAVFLTHTRASCLQRTP